MESKAIFFNNKTKEKKQPVKKIISTLCISKPTTSSTGGPILGPKESKTEGNRPANKKGVTSPNKKEAVGGGDRGAASTFGSEVEEVGEEIIEGNLNNTKVIKSGRLKKPKKNGAAASGLQISCPTGSLGSAAKSSVSGYRGDESAKEGDLGQAAARGGEVEFSAPIFSNLEIKLKSPINITKLNEIHSKKTYITELAPSKKISRFKISMIDMNSKLEIEYNEFSIFNYSCFWCRHPFKTLPIGCPVDFIPTSARKKYVSCINNEEYTILENIIDSQKTTDNFVSINDRNYYITDGIFCSFNCCQAYINDNPKTMYRNSSSLLLKIYMYYLDILEEKYEIDSIVITPAPSWRTLICYGGFLSIEEFRSSFNKIIYTLNGKTNAYEYIKNIPIQFRFDENLIF